ncbi:MAG: AbrB/MazE/SpoVT family DNA-binding domain-containing protein [Thermoplasmata archaeon]|nr:AbrB/MazE/SpoVT family DNA-binding domain-containing protein [Thermoplasmata archaeon]
MASPLVGPFLVPLWVGGAIRVTIPQVIATTLGLRPGDDLLWIVDPRSGVVRIEAAKRAP